MKIIVSRIGSGTDANPYRAGLPTYSLVSESVDGKEWEVEVPEEDAPERGKVHAEWHRALDDRYREHDGEFRPTLRGAPLRGRLNDIQPLIA